MGRLDQILTGRPDYLEQLRTGVQTVARGAQRVAATCPEVRPVRVPVLLGRPGYGGTIAAIRDLAQDQIPILVLAGGLLECGRWSKYVSAAIPTGPQADPRALLAALEKQVGHREGGVAPVLLPCCDNSAWTYAAHADKLAPHFCLYAPPLETMNRILDKGQFEAACADAGVPVLKSWTVRDEAALAQIADRLVFPLIIKPRTHVRRRRNDKGEVVANQDELVKALRRIRRSDTFFEEREGDREADRIGSADSFLQQFVEIFPQGVLSVTGFIDRTGAHFLAGAARKILLRSEPAGVGVCFESTPLDPVLAEQTACLCRKLGYFGAFEVEFIWDGARWAAIDFNPRFFNQMALDIARGLPLARLCYYDAIGDRYRLAALAEQAEAAARSDKICVRDGITMHLILTFRSLTGRMSWQDRLAWHQWARTNRARMKDLIRTWDDPWIWPVHILSEVRLGLRKLFSLTKIRWAKAGRLHA